LPATSFSNRILQIAAASLGLLLLSGGAAAQSGGLSVNGYFKSYLFLFQPAWPDNAGLSGLSTNRFRVDLSYKPRKWMDMDAAYDIVPRVQSSDLSTDPLWFRQIDPFIYRAADLDRQLYPQESGAIKHFSLVQNFDRAMVTFHTQPADITVGRQPVAWGSARVVNPTDVLAPFAFETLDTEDRIGIDAVRTRIPLGTLSEIDAGYVFGRHFRFENSAFFGRAKFNANKTDISLLALGFQENFLAGLDLASSVSGAGLWLETAYVFVDAFGDYGAGRKYDYFRASSGIDYSFGSSTYGFVEYHFNGAGAASQRDYFSRLSRPAYTEGSVYLTGRHYLIPGVAYQLSPLVTLTGESLINLLDPSVFLTAQAEYNIATNVYLDVGAFIGIGRKPATEADEVPLVPQSEFGAYPNIYFASLRYYF
jgi:hypothetical protein